MGRARYLALLVVPLAACLLAAPAQAVAPAAAAGHAGTLKLTGVVDGLVQADLGPESALGPKKVTLLKHDKKVGTMSFTGSSSIQANGCSASPFFRCAGDLRLAELKDVPSFDLTFESFADQSPNAPGQSDLQVPGAGLTTDVGTITVKVGSMGFARAHARFPVVIQLNAQAG